MTPSRSSGKERDTETSFDFFGARYYVSSHGRFLTPDWNATPVPVPYAHLDNPQTLNLYAYVDNNPVTAVDADGHKWNIFGQPGSPGWMQRIANLFTPTPAPPAPAVPATRPKNWLDQYKPPGGGGKTVEQIANVVYQETRPMSQSKNSNEPLTTARERIADVYLNGNHKMAPGTDKTNTPQETVAREDSLQATRNAVENRAVGIDITGGAFLYNQSPVDHSGKAGGGDFCPNGCPNRTSSGPYENGNPTPPVERYINTYDGK